MSAIQIAPGNSLTEFLYHKATRMHVPISGTFELSPVCNFDCRMCYVRKTAREVAESPRPILTLEDWRSIARQARDAGMLDLLLTGGEPLLWPDFWTLYEELIDMGFQISINTNGSLIDEAAIRRFTAKPPHRVNVTVYGASEETYFRLCGNRSAYSLVDRAIRNLKAAGITVKLNCSLTPQNAADLEQIVAYAREIDTVLSVATYMFPPIRRCPDMVGINERFTPEESGRYLMDYLRLDRGEKGYRHYLKSIADGYAEPTGLDEGCIDPADGKVRCRAGRASFWITWDGWMTPCGMMPQPWADLRQLDFHQAWQQIMADTAELRLSGACESCPARNICHPCAAISLAETGSTAGIPTYMCRSVAEMQRIALSEQDKLP